ncbi:MAG: flagellar export protein FliJ [Selenomonadaceae bacterium]|nr:flagellar export protein FliJ [Selenomonadaceae bacterium]MBR6342709.1 flagellar export protein FliJ [Selenomonadaceae bacterium]MBR6906234.1 flagellar export protein FliJ [Selenomonadaceae bacterium]
MKKFKFQLETLLKVTRMKKEDAEVKFAEVSRRLEEQRARLTQLLEEMQRGQREYEELSGEGKTLTVGRIMTYNSFFNWKRMQIEEQQKLILKTREEKQRALKELMDVMSYLKSIEQLKEKRLQEYKDLMLFEEQKMLDEIGLQLYMRHA